MRQFPREIEADLLFRGIDIHDWHQGRMSSRRLLCLIDALPDDSAYWKERRDGDWDDRMYLAAAQVNELRRLRADQAAIHADFKMEVVPVISPAQGTADDDLKNKHDAVRSHVMSQLLGKTE